MKRLHYPRIWFSFSHKSLIPGNAHIEKLDKMDGYIANEIMYPKIREMNESYCYSDTLEEEADRIALQLLARACFDVREVEKICTALHRRSPTWDVEKIPEEMEKHRYIYKHSFNDHKQLFIRDNLAKFVEFRQKCNCAPLTWTLFLCNSLSQSCSKYIFVVIFFQFDFLNKLF